MKPRKKEHLYSTLIKAVWIAFTVGLFALILLVYSVNNNFMGLYGNFPSYEMLENPESENTLASELYSSDGVLLGKYFRQNRSYVDYEELSPYLVNALMATEDVRFTKHSGIDLKGIVRAAIGKLTFRFAGGGSTLTQQLAENLFFNRSQDYKGFLHKTMFGLYVDKIKEWIVSVKLERDYTKKEIMAMYLNTVEFGSNAYGIKVATRTFFNKTPAELNPQEAAILVGMLQAPSRYSPVFNYDNALHRRNVVLNQMNKYGFINNPQADSLKKLPIELDYNVESHNEGIATYFRSAIRGFLLDWCKEQNIDLFSSGLRIYATIDSRMQRYAEEAVKTKMAPLQKRFENHWGSRNPWIDENGVEIKDFLERQIAKSEHYQSLVKEFGRNADTIDVILNAPRKMKVFSWNGEIDTLLSPIDSLKYYKRFLQTGFMAMDPHSGDIKAWVGGINHRYFKFDHVMQGRRQPGSTFKPVVYTAAIDNYFSPCYPVIDAPVTFNLPGQNPPTWTPSNADGKYSGQALTLRQAMARSVNSVTAFVMKRIGPETVVEYAKKLGIKSHLDAVPSLCLGGGGEVSVYELVGAYATFVNQGVHTDPRYISRIEDKNGNVWVFPPRTQEAISEETAFLMVYMLMGGAEPGGTAIGLNRELRVDNEIGGKTGTTQNASDGWFMGITKDLVAGAWVGGDERSIRFRNWYDGQGGRTAMPIWEEFMMKVYADQSLGYQKGIFKRPDRRLNVELDCEKYKNTSPGLVDMDSTNQRPAFDPVKVEDIF